MNYKVNTYVEPHYPIQKSLLVSTATTVLNIANVKGKVELSVSIVGDRKMRKLNKQFRGIDTTTDVLAFPYSFEGEQTGFTPPSSKFLNLGDVVISYPQLLSRAAEENTLVDEMAMYLVSHGVLHLLGYDHEKMDEAEKMGDLEDKIIASLRPAPEIIK